MSVGVKGQQTAWRSHDVHASPRAEAAVVRRVLRNKPDADVQAVVGQSSGETAVRQGRASHDLV